VISERQALEALLLSSADNIAWMLARWDAGSQAAFAAKMNAAARAVDRALGGGRQFGCGKTDAHRRESCSA
jgi:hypothetical protein